MKGRNLASELCVPEDERALEVFRCIRWSEGVYCPACKSFEVYNRGYLNKTQIKRYSCKTCGKNFTDLTGTIFANKKLPLGEMFYIILNLDKKSIKRLAEELGHKWDSVYRIAHEFRGCLVNEADNPVLSGEIEFDEMYQSAGTKGLKKHPRTRGLKLRGRGTYEKDKPPIISIIERRTRKTILVVEKNLSKDLIHKKIQTHCKGSIKAFTDDYTIYIGLEEHPQVIEHHTINHSEKEYAEGENHVNNCENRHSLLRPYLNIFRGVSKTNLNNYVKFFQFTFNNGINWFQKALELILKSCTYTGR